MEEEIIENETGNELNKLLFELSTEELKELAKNKNIQMVGVSRKPDMIFYIQEAGEVTEEEITTAKNNLLVKPQANVVKPKQINKKTKVEIDSNKTAIFSEKNMFSSTYGRIEKGYSIVTRDMADYFIQQKSVREVSPQEVAEYYGAK